MSEGEVSRENLIESVGKYISITEPTGEGISGWVISASAISVAFDYGMSWTPSVDATVEEVEPPPNDPEMFIPDNHGDRKA